MPGPRSILVMKWRFACIGCWQLSHGWVRVAEKTFESNMQDVPPGHAERLQFLHLILSSASASTCTRLTTASFAVPFGSTAV